MLLDNLVETIETLKGRISAHRESLRQNEFRTRVALIDPLLQALGWDVSDPSLVTPEYDVNGRRADYALLELGNAALPAATLEAKKLNEPLESYQMQMLNYSNFGGIRYAGLTNGDRWDLYEIFRVGTLEERRILNVSISQNPAPQLALKLLLLWRPNLATGTPKPAETPILPVPAPEPTKDNNLPPPPEGWISIKDLDPGKTRQTPSTIRFPNGQEAQLRYWNSVLLETAEYLIRNGLLTPNRCPVPVPKGTRYIVHHEAVHSNKRGFTDARKLSNGLFCEVNTNPSQLLAYTKALLAHCGQNPADFYVKPG